MMVIFSVTLSDPETQLHVISYDVEYRYLKNLAI